MTHDAGVSMREFARQVGRSVSWVSGKCKAGELPLIDGKIPLKEGLQTFKALVKAEQIQKAKRHTSRATSEVFRESNDDGDHFVASSLNVHEAFNKARLAKEVATAKIKDLEYKKLKGEYVSVEEVKADAREAAAMLRSFALSAPTRYSVLLENRTQREAEEVIEEIFRELLTTINESKFVKD